MEIPTFFILGKVDRKILILPEHGHRVRRCGKKEVYYSPSVRFSALQANQMVSENDSGGDIDLQSQ